MSAVRNAPSSESPIPRPSTPPPSGVTPRVITTAPTTTRAVDASRYHGDSAHAIVLGPPGPTAPHAMGWTRLVFDEPGQFSGRNLAGDVSGADHWRPQRPQPPVGWQPSRMPRIAGTAQPRPPGGHARTPRVVVDGGGGRWPYPLPCARQRFTFCPATRRSSLSLAVGVKVASTWVDPPRRWREGQAS
jgi:hypothetical protein